MKNITKKLRWLAVPAMFLSALINAEAAFSQGSQEIDFSASYSSWDANGGDMDLLLLSGSYGYFVTENIEISGELTHLDADVGVDNLEATLLGIGGDYHFSPNSNFVPYVGGGFNYVDAEMAGFGGDDDWAWEVRAGIKQFLTDNVLVKYEVNYMEFDDLELDGINVSIGLGFVF